MKDIDRPLGKQRRRAKRGGPWRVRPGTLLLAACAVAVVTASTAISLRERPFRDPPRGLVSAPDAAALADAKPSLSDNGDEPAEDDGQADADPGESGSPAPRIEAEGLAESDSVIVVRDPSSANRDQRLAHLPDRALIEESETGPLPVRGADGRRPFDAYAREWSGARGTRVAIVIGGLGLSQTGTQEAIDKLPSEITLAFAPHGYSLDRWMQTARREGHEIMMQVPLEPYDYPNVSPGRDTLTVDSEPAEKLASLHRTLSRITNYTGIMNYMGARFTADEDAMSDLMGELARRGLGFLDDGTSARSVAEETARSSGVPFALGDAVIDEERERGEILDKLDELERTARANGAAIGTGSAFEVTVDAVASWAADARKRGIEVVPVTAVTRDPEDD